MNVQEKIAQAKATKATTLDLSEMALTTVPTSIAELTHLKQLNLSKNNLQTLHPSIGKLQRLEAINLWSNSLHELPKEFGHLKSLKQLDLEDNHLIEIPPSVFKLKELRILDLEHNSIIEIGDEIVELQLLQQLDISRNKLQKINAKICKLSQLALLNLKGNLLTDLPSQVCDMRRMKQLIVHGNLLDEELVEAAATGQKAVQRYFRKKIVIDKIRSARENELIKLDLSHQDITDIPEDIFTLTKLKILGLDSNNIWEISDKITQLTALEVLDLSHNQLVEIPAVLSKMPHLKVIETMGNPILGSGLLPKVEMRRQEVKKRIQEAKNNHSEELDLSDCGLTTIPAQVLQMSNLKRLILGRYYKKEDDFRHRNYISSLPGKINRLNHLQYLDLTGNALTTLPDEFSTLNSLQSLNLSQNQLRKVPKVLYKLKFNLKSLDLSYNYLKTVSTQFSALKNLEHINLTFNQMDEYPTALGQLSQLRSIQLQNNRIEELPNDLGNLSVLQDLNLSHNELTELPKSLASLTNIERLTVSNNKLVQLHGNIHLMRFGLKELDVSNNNLKHLPVGVRQLIKLKSLDVSNNKLSVFPNDALELKQLEALVLHHNQIKDLPKELVNMKKLGKLDLTFNPFSKSLIKPIKKGVEGIKEWFFFKEAIDRIQAVKGIEGATLDLSNLKLRSIPRELFELKSLKILKLGKDYGELEDKSQQNTIAHLTKSFGRLEGLEELYLQHNDISHLSNELIELKKLKVINLEYNQLKKITPSISEMRQLEYVNFNHNQLRDLPMEISKLSNLKEVHWSLNQFRSPLKEVVKSDLSSLQLWFGKEYVAKKIEEARRTKVDKLDLSSCSIEVLPPQVFELRNLKHINLANNQLKNLPKDIQKLTNLENLDISNNQLDRIPTTLLDLSNLKNIRYQNNPLSKIPVSIQQLGWTGVEQWLTQQVINEKIEIIIEGITFEEKPLYQKDTVICQVCHGKKELSGQQKYLDIKFKKQSCYGCQGLGLIDYESEQIHLILHNAQTHLHKIERRLKTILHQKRAFEESILFAPSTNHQIISEQVKKGFNNILERYTGQLRVLAERYDFYKNVQQRVHKILYNQYMLYSALGEFRKLESMEGGLALNFEEKAAMQKGIISEVEALNKYVGNSNGLMIPEDFMDIVGDLAKRFEAYA